MTSITKIFILIIGIVAISGEALNSNTDRPTSIAPLPDNHLLYHVENKRGFVYPDPLKIIHCNHLGGSLGCIRRRPVLSSERTESNTDDLKYFNRENWSKRQQPVVKTDGLDDGPNPVISLLTTSSPPLRSMIRNRSRRSASIPGTSSNKNATVEAVPPKHCCDRPPKLTFNDRLLIRVLMALTAPYLLATPTDEYKDPYEAVEA